jgi:NADPH:quinone reductase-like Zn-dependent oxidoreductase
MTATQTMRALQAHGFSIAALKLGQQPIPRPRRGEILVRVRAASLNYRDLAILTEKYMPSLPLPYVPASDASGEVVELGEDVTRFKVGERVTPIYTQAGMTGCRRWSCARGAPWAHRSAVCCRTMSQCRPKMRWRCPGI